MTDKPYSEMTDEPTDKEAATEIKRILSEGSKFSYPVFPDNWAATETSNQF